jgi:hypothetical protein
MSLLHAFVALITTESINASACHGKFSPDCGSWMKKQQGLKKYMWYEEIIDIKHRTSRPRRHDRLQQKE